MSSNHIKNDVLGEIKEVQQLLNGKTLEGKKATYLSQFRPTRYMVLLYALTNVDIFRDQTIDFEKLICSNFYNLKKLADNLYLEFDRTKSAIKIYQNLKATGDVTIVTKQHKTYVCLTKKGMKRCKRRLGELMLLKRYFVLNPKVQNDYEQRTEDKRTKLIEELKSEKRKLNREETALLFHEPTKESIVAEKLVRNISDWN